MRPGDRLVCALITPLHENAAFEAWPLHVTIVPWFRLVTDSAGLAAALRAVWQPVRPFTIRMGEENVQFGHQPGKLATLVQQPTPLTEVEQRLRQYLHSQQAWLVDESTKERRTFRPHVTVQAGAAVHEGDDIQCRQLYIIEQRGGYKEVAAIVPLT